MPTTNPAMSSPRLTVRLAAASLMAGLGLVVGLGAATPATAQPVTVSQDPTTLKMICGKYGGMYIPPNGTSGAGCLYPDGTYTHCDLHNNCTTTQPDRSGAPEQQPDVVGNAPDVTAGDPGVPGAPISGRA